VSNSFVAFRTAHVPSASRLRVASANFESRSMRPWFCVVAKQEVTPKSGYVRVDGDPPANRHHSWVANCSLKTEVRIHQSHSRMKATKIKGTIGRMKIGNAPFNSPSAQTDPMIATAIGNAKPKAVMRARPDLPRCNAQPTWPIERHATPASAQQIRLAANQGSARWREMLVREI
jgi:hypothetical protein